MKSRLSPHYRDYSGKLRDYNGVGRWSKEQVRERYLVYCKKLKVANPEVPQPRETKQGDVHWIFPVMEVVIKGIKSGDKACVLLGIEFMEEDDHFPFGRTLKTNTARALRRNELTTQQILRLRKRIINMLLAGNVPGEFGEYAKLLRHIGIGDRRPEIEASLENANPYVSRWSNYLLSDNATPTSKRAGR